MVLNKPVIIWIYIYVLLLTSPLKNNILNFKYNYKFKNMQKSHTMLRNMHICEFKIIIDETSNRRCLVIILRYTKKNAFII